MTIERRVEAITIPDVGGSKKLVMLSPGESCVNGELVNEVVDVLLSVEHVLKHYCRHPDFGIPDVLIGRVDALLEDFENRKLA